LRIAYNFALYGVRNTQYVAGPNWVSYLRTIPEAAIIYGAKNRNQLIAVFCIYLRPPPGRGVNRSVFLQFRKTRQVTS